MGLVVEERIHSSGMVYWARVRVPKGKAPQEQEEKARASKETKARSAPVRSTSAPKAPPRAK